jgi:hypothetical protein
MNDGIARRMEAVREALDVYEGYVAGSQSDQALGRAIVGELARSASDLLTELRFADLERRQAERS